MSAFKYAADNVAKYNILTVNLSFIAYACHEVYFVAKFIWSRTYVPKSSRHEVTFHHKEEFESLQNCL